MTIVSASDWEAFISRHPEAHILQSRAWGDLKSEFGWEVVRIISDGDLGVQILFRPLPFGLRIAYIPKGPVNAEGLLEARMDGLWGEIDVLCKERRAIFLKLEPDIWVGDAAQDVRKPWTGLRASRDTIQPPRTLVVNIELEDADILASMKQKTRYNIRLASRKGVQVSSSADIDLFYRLARLTGRRNEFGVHSMEYYRRAYELFNPSGQCELLVAEYDSEPLGAVMVFAFGRRAWYFYGASSNQHRERMPTYLLQWKAMQWAREKGCREYDLWGVPDEDHDDLENNFTHRSDGLWGVYRFKRGFGGELRRAIGPYDRVYNTLLYTLYRLRVKWGDRYAD
jgi:peptidoglycan pentaglycine glycine transferase (the first glycine)